MDKVAISQVLDITDPFLMIDEWEEIEAGKAAIGYYSLESEHWYMKAHLPSVGAMPATLMTEGMLQTLVLLIYSAEPHGTHRAYINESKVKFLASPEVGALIKYSAELKMFGRGIAKGMVTAWSREKEIARGEFTYASPHLMGFIT